MREKVATARNRGWQIVELCINKKLAIEKTKNESKTEQRRKRKREREKKAKKAKKTLRPHYEILLALSSLWIKMNYCTATATTTTTTMATTVRTTITTRVNNGNGNHNTSKR